MPAEPQPDIEAQRRRAQKLLWRIIGTVIAFNLGLLLWIFLR